MSSVLKVSLIAVIVLAGVCVCVMPAARAGGVVPLLWTSPTSERLNSVFMVSSDDGWAVGEDGTIIRWAGTDWIPEFPTSMLTSFLVTITLVAVILTKTGSRKRRGSWLSGITRAPISLSMS